MVTENEAKFLRIFVYYCSVSMPRHDDGHYSQ